MKAGTLWTAALFGLALPAAAMAQERAPYYGHHMWEGGWHGWFLGPIFMILMIIVLVVAVILVVRWLGGAPGHSGMLHHAPGGKTPLDILKERFAKGEIDKEEFEERRRILGE